MKPGGQPDFANPFLHDPVTLAQHLFRNLATFLSVTSLVGLTSQAGFHVCIMSSAYLKHKTCVQL
ncbi:hypothetical protein J6590_011525 [Homalodisca vitripennis]|nr:hypothetical protein J6590_011525 [Homalodisca vitripennis]